MMAEVIGFGPILDESKSSVLPLHHTSVLKHWAHIGLPVHPGLLLPRSMLMSGAYFPQKDLSYHGIKVFPTTHRVFKLYAIC